MHNKISRVISKTIDIGYKFQTRTQGKKLWPLKKQQEQKGKKGGKNRKKNGQIKLKCKINTSNISTTLNANRLNLLIKKAEIIRLRGRGGIQL